MRPRNLLCVAYVTPNYVGVPSGQVGEPLTLVHKSQVTGSPRVGDWVALYELDGETYLEAQGAPTFEPEESGLKLVVPYALAKTG